jgi:hypothetical protein
MGWLKRIFARGATETSPGPVGFVCRVFRQGGQSIIQARRLIREAQQVCARGPPT